MNENEVEREEAADDDPKESVSNYYPMSPIFGYY